MTLDLEIGPEAPPVLPLELQIASDRHRRLVDWPLALPLDGTVVPLQAPTIEAVGHAHAPMGPYALPVEVVDDGAVDHVVVWVNGEKVAWSPGGSSSARLVPTFDLEEGNNQIVIQTEDDRGIHAHKALTVRGEPEPEAVDADL